MSRSAQSSKSSVSTVSTAGATSRSAGTRTDTRHLGGTNGTRGAVAVVDRPVAATPARTARRGRKADAAVAPAQPSGRAKAPVIETEPAPAPAVSKGKVTKHAPRRNVTRSSAPAAAATRAAKAPPKPVPLSERPIDQVWREYRVTPNDEIRNFLIARHLDLVAYAAERLHKRLPSEVEINDLKSAGAFGLMDAVDAFDPDRGVKFETFCTQRIRGAMFDELRSMDWVPRLVRSRTAKVEKVRKSIEMETGRRATEDEVATRLNVSGEEFDKLQKDSRPISMVSLTRKCFETDSSKDV
ncbi:MAG: sigma-70 family RNA polymerase sigma factor, partial [Planctomycetota bacterium]